MSEENLQKPNEEATPEVLGGYEIVFNKATNEIVIKDPKGQTATLRATVIEPDDEEEEPEPLTPEQFGEALRKIDELGLTWTADRVPRVKAKEGQDETALLSDEFIKLQEDYPNLPKELSIVVSYALTGGTWLADEVGGGDALEQKAEIVSDVVLTIDYRSEFFFKHALKVPYFSNIDWEVVFKFEEKNVRNMPGVSYALLTLLFHDENAEASKHKTMTVAVDTGLVNKLLERLGEVKAALERARQVTEIFYKQSKEKDKGDEISEQKPVE